MEVSRCLGEPSSPIKNVRGQYMGTLKLRNIKHKTHLWDSLAYIMQDSKTENGQYIFGNSGYTTQMAYHTFLDTKRLYDKRDGRQAYHYILTFAEEDCVQPELARDITEEFMKRLFPQDEYDWVGAVHTDTEHLHAHILFNSVNRNTGYKYRYEKGDWEKTIQRIVDDICNEHGLTTIAYDYTPDGKVTPVEKKEKQAENYEKHSQEIKSKADLVRQDIDRCIKEVKSYEEFLSKLKEDGYSIQRQGTSKQYGEYLTLKPYGAANGLRTYRLGTAYTLKRIKERILKENVPQPTTSSAGQKEISGEKEYERIVHIAALPTITYRRYYVKCLYLAKRWKNGKPFPHSYLYKTAVIENQKMMEEYQLLKKAGFRTREEILQYKNELEHELKDLYKVQKDAEPQSERCKQIEQKIKTYQFNKRTAARLAERVEKIPISKDTLRKTMQLNKT